MGEDYMVEGELKEGEGSRDGGEGVPEGADLRQIDTLLDAIAIVVYQLYPIGINLCIKLKFSSSQIWMTVYIYIYCTVNMAYGCTA
jgi:hypothetical protein